MKLERKKNSCNNSTINYIRQDIPGIYFQRILIAHNIKNLSFLWIRSQLSREWFEEERILSSYKIWRVKKSRNHPLLLNLLLNPSFPRQPCHLSGRNVRKGGEIATESTRLETISDKYNEFLLRKRLSFSHSNCRRRGNIPLDLIYKAGQQRLLEGRSRVTLIRESPRGRQAALSKWVSGSRRLLP